MASNPAEAQKKLLSNAFDSDERTVFDSMLGQRSSAPTRDDDDDEITSMSVVYDGRSAAKELTGRDVYKAVQPIVQSREGRRSPDVYKNVLNQFAVGSNPRYVEDGPGKQRAHIFVWDVSRAMNSEIPHFIGAKELTIAATCDWLRHEGPMRGWRRTDQGSGVEAADQGMLVIAVPKDVSVKMLAVVRPIDRAPDGKPMVAAAGFKRGNSISLKDALEVFAVEYFVHP